MTNLEKYTHTFVETLGIMAEQTNGLMYQDVEAWDSVGHIGRCF